MSNTTPRARRNRLLASCAAAAIATLTLHAPVRAQGFRGTPITAPQGATVTTPNGTTTTVIVEAPKAIVNWQADNNDFLPVGNTANFVNSEARIGQTYTILNRIKPATNDPTGRVQLNGTIRSTLDLSTANGAPGGNIWFYSPNGLLVGSGAQINVGSLLLSSLDVLDEQFVDGGTIRFGDANVLDVPLNPNASVEVQGNISALGQNAYVALIAPRVVQSGAITVAGSAHYVAAEAVDMTINGSLFDIAVQVGSSVGGDGSPGRDAALVHDGTTTLQGEENGYGPQPASGRSAVFVAVPKNDAVTMLVQGVIDYVPASGATVDGNKIILSAGRNVVGGEIDTASRPGNPTGVANIRIENANPDGSVFRPTRFGGDVAADATGAITVAARDTIPESGYGPFPPDIDFARSVSLKAERGVDMSAVAKAATDAEGGFLRVGGDLVLDASSTSGAGTGDVRLASQTGGRIEVLGSATLRADTSSEGFTTGDGASVVNNRIVEIAGQGGAIQINGSATLSADANGGSGSGAGGSATGGTARIVNSGAGDIVILGNAQIEADGRGGSGGSEGAGGSGTGGTARIETSAGRIDIRGSFVELQANGSGESGYGPGGGAGTGGTVALVASGGGAISLNIGADFGGNFIRAEGAGGSSIVDGAGGAARGGTAIVSATGGGRITSEFDLDVAADAFGGNAFSDDGAGGDAEGGTASIVADNGDLNIEGHLFVSVDAEGGNGGVTGGDAIAGGGDGSLAPGGVSLLVANGGRIDAGVLTLRATGTGGRGLDGGDGTGGRVTSVIGGDGFLNVLDDFNLFVDGIGGSSDDTGYGEGSFGTGRGGAIVLDVDGDGETFGELNVVGTTLLSAAGNPFRFSEDAFARAAPSANGGDGFGGTVDVTVNGDFSSNNVRVDVSGRGNAGIDDTLNEAEGVADEGSTGQGGTGTVTIGANAETVDIGTLEVDADGSGGDGGDAALPGRGGVGQGGTAALVVDGGETVIDFIEFSAAGSGGDGGLAGFGQAAAGGTGGAGIGGTASLTVNAADPFIGGVFVDLEGSGGRGGNSDDGSGGTGGLGQGGTLALTVMGGGALTIPTQTYSASGLGGSGGFGESNGGDGGAGGAGIGGTIEIDVTDSMLSAPSDAGYGTVFSARGFGGSGASGRSFGGEGAGVAGDGGQGGTGTGGAILFTGTNADLTFGGLELASSGQGGSGGGGGDGFGAAGGNGGRGGNATGGTAELALSDDGTGSISINGFGGIDVSARASGGLGAEGGNGVTGGISGDGGNAQGGIVRIAFDGGFALSPVIAGDASASGGEGASAFDTGDGQESATGGSGGSGTGGSVTLAVTGGDVRLAPFTQLTAFGDGGLGGSSAGLAGGAGGAGTGGLLNVSVTGGDLSAPALSLRADGFGASGGEGGDNEAGGNGGRGGNADGGVITLATAGSGRLVTNFADGRGLEAHADARAGTGGGGGDGSEVGDTGGRGGDAGDAQGGSVAFAVEGGEMDLGDIKVTANGWGGGFSNGGIGAGRAAIPDSNPEDGIDDSQPEIPPTFAPGGSDGRGAGGTIEFRVADAETGEAGRFTAGAVSLRATGRVGGGSNDASGFISMVRTAAAPGGLFQIASLEAKALGLNGEAPIGFELDSAAGAIEILNNAAIEVDKDAALRSAGSGTLTVGGELNLLVGGNLALAQATGSTQPLASADLVRINAGSVAGASAALTAVRDIRVFSPGSVSFGLLDAGDDIVIDALSASIGQAVTRGPDEPGEEENAGSSIIVNTTGDIELLIGATAADDIRLTSSEGGVANTGAQATSLSAGGRVDIQAELDIRLASVAAVDDVGINAFSGSVTSSGLIESGDDVRVNAFNGSIALTDVAAGDLINLSAGNDLSLANATAGGELNLFGGDIVLTGSGIGANVLASGDTLSLGDLTATSPEFGGEGNNGIVLRASGDASIRNGTSASRIDVDTGGFTATGTLTAAEAVLIDLTDRSGGSGIADLGTVRAAYVEVDARNGIQADDIATTFGTVGDLNDGRVDLSSLDGDIRLDNASSPGVIAVAVDNGSFLSAGLIRADFLISNVTADIALNDVEVASNLFLTTFGGSIGGNRFRSDGDIFLTARDGVSVAALDAFSFIDVDGISGPISIGSATTSALGGEGGGGIFLHTNGLVTLDQADSAGFLDVAGLGFGGGDLLAGSFIRIVVSEQDRGEQNPVGRVAALGGIAFDTANAGTFVELGAPGPIDAGTIFAGSDILANGGSIAIADATAGRDILLAAADAIDLGTARAGDDIEAASRFGAITVADATTTGLGEDIGLETGYGPGPGDGSNIRLAGQGVVTLDKGDAIDLVSLTSSGDRVTSAGLIKATDLDVSSNGDIALTDLDIANGISLFAGNGSITGADFASGRFIALTASGDADVASLTAPESIFVQAANIDIGSATTTQVGGEDGSGISLFGSRNVAIGFASSGDFVDLAGGSIDAGTLTAASFIRANADSEAGGTGAVAFDRAEAGSFVSLAASGDITGGTAIAGTDFDANGTAITLASVTAGDDITILAGATASVAAVTTTGAGTDSEGDGFGIAIEAAGDVSFGAAEAVGDLRLVSREGGIVRLDVPGASLIDAGGSLFVSAADDLNLSSVLAGQNITLISGGAIDTGNLTAPGALSLTAGDALSADVVRAGSLIADAASIEFADVELAGVLDLATPGALVLGRAKASGIFGSASQVRAGALEAAGNIVLSAATSGVEVGSADAGGSIALIAANGPVSGTSLTADGAINMTAANGDARLGTGLAGSDITLAGRNVTLSDGMAGRDIVVQASGDAAIGSAKAGDDFTADTGGAFAGTTVITTGEGPDGEEDNGYGIIASAADDGSNIRLTSIGAIALETGTAADAIALASSNGAVGSAKALTAGAGILANAAGAVSLADATAGGDIELTAGTGIAAANLVGGTDVRLQAKGGDVMLTNARAGDDIDVAATGTTTIARATTTGSAPDDGNNGATVLVTSPGGVSIARIESAGGAVLRAANGAVTVSEDLRSVRPVDASGRSVSLRSLGALGVRAAVASAGNVALNSAGNLSLENADASGSVAVASAASLGITGTVGGAQIALTSRDIAIGSAAQIGSAARTSMIQVTANGTSATAPAVVGGSGQGSNYRLDNAEFGRLAAQNVAISAQGETAALQVDTLTVRQPSVTRSLTLSSSGDVAVIGRVTYENAGAENAVRVNAARAFTASTPAAGIVVATAQGALTGSIDVDARSIVVASGQAQTDLTTTSNIAARDDRLGRNDGETDNAGVLRAGAIRLAASERIFVQNSGVTSDENDDRAGLSAGAGGITLVTKGTSPVEIVINGRQDDGAGGFIVGAALIDELTITGQDGGPGSFAPGSTVNGCLIGGANCLGLPLNFGVPVEPIISELTEEEDEDEEDNAFAGPPSVGFNQLITTDGSPLLPVIDDPVTGAGNDDLSTGTGPLVDIDNSQRDREEQVNMPVTGTGNDALQGGTAPPTPAGSRPDSQPTIDDPVTGAGNDDLQDGPNP